MFGELKNLYTGYYNFPLNSIKDTYISVNAMSGNPDLFVDIGR